MISRFEKVILWVCLVVLLVANLLLLIYADSAKIAGYMEGFDEGQKWKQEDKFRTWQAWQEYGQARMEFFMELSRRAHLEAVEASRVEYLERMLSAGKEGLGWETGRSNAP